MVMENCENDFGHVTLKLPNSICKMATEPIAFAASLSLK